MLCPQCGREVGDTPRLCDPCSAERVSRLSAAQPAAAPSAKEFKTGDTERSESERYAGNRGDAAEERVHRVSSRDSQQQVRELGLATAGECNEPPVVVALLRTRMGLWISLAVLTFLVVFALHLALSPKQIPLQALIVAGLVTSGMVAIGTWVAIWTDFFLENPTIALFCLLVNFAVYYHVMAHPERVMRTAVVHFLSIAGVFVLGFTASELYPSTAPGGIEATVNSILGFRLFGQGVLQSYY